MSIDLSPTERYGSGVSMRLASGSEPTVNSQQHAKIFGWLTQRVRVSRRSRECALAGIGVWGATEPKGQGDAMPDSGRWVTTHQWQM